MQGAANLQHRISYRLLEIFNNWFTSSGGVWQTMLITVCIVIAERLFPRTDPHGFWLLYWLTVYSAVTQPALAYSGRQSSEQIAVVIARMQELEEQAALDRERNAQRSKLMMMYLVAWHHDAHGDECHCWQGKESRADELLDEFLEDIGVPDGCP